MIIDFHTHAFKEELAPRTMAKISGASGFKNYGDGTLAALISRQRARGIGRSVLLNIAVSPKSVCNVNNFAIEANAREEIIAFGSVHPQNDNYKSELMRLKDAGIIGIKLHPCYQGFMIDDFEAFPMYEEIVRAGMICVFHAGFDPLDTTRSFSTPSACLKVHQAFPEMKMVLAHMGGAKEVEDAEKYLWGEDVYIDIAVMAGYAREEEILRFLKKHREDRILYGSDFPWHDAEELQFLAALPMDGARKEKILSLNALALLNKERI